MLSELLNRELQLIGEPISQSRPLSFRLLGHLILKVFPTYKTIIEVCEVDFSVPL